MTQITEQAEALGTWKLSCSFPVFMNCMLSRISRTLLPTVVNREV